MKKAVSWAYGSNHANDQRYSEMAKVIDSDELRARDEGWRQCIEARDAEAVVEYLDDDYTLVVLQPERSVTSRDRWLKTLPDYHVHEWRVEDQVIDVDGDLGVIFQRIFMRATVLGTDRSTSSS